MTAISAPDTLLTGDYAPRDFSARLRRSRVHSLRKTKAPRHYGRRALVLLAAVALPAFAAPPEWSPASWVGDIAAADSSEAQVAPMPFERPGDSFPGAAFYYLANDPAPRALGEGIHSDAEPAPTEVAVGPAARAMRIDNSGVDRSRALQCLTAAIYYEAASEPDAGQRAVAQVVLNRVAHPSYPKTVCGVVFQGSERSTGCQFSFTCDGALARVPNRMFWQRAENVARAALSGFVYAPVGLATHYHTVAVHPYWAPSLNYLGTIGAHRFYRFGGAAGAPATFRFTYLGGEPVAAPHAHATTPATAEAVPDPVAIQRAYDAGLKAAQSNAYLPGGTLSAATKAAPTPIYSAELQRRGGDALYRGDLPGSTGVLPEYQQSGSWIAQPGT
ncbi:cell wall hydrolase [Novosphingobium sp. JCM 18896]|uniref:cell wall hydrolase n=1 Tax=Novosphingobium sp. JCM 18896 TaxID=2989731 RepID=UPI0022221EC5|nr:cell wall hydrolase [Novosphingobium sp. JCM 18896]MCW1430015.1 cell wall hydrolase [Novosphingobium sp. JCM 18896]